MTSTTAARRADIAPLVRRAIARRSFCSLATSSAASRPHVAAVLYAAVDDGLYVSTLEGSRKLRDIRENPRVAVQIPVRRFPVGPPFSIHLRGRAEEMARDDPALVELLRTGRLKKITGHGVLDDPQSCFVRIVPDRRVSTYGLGVPLRTLLRDPLHASRSVDLS